MATVENPSDDVAQRRVVTPKHTGIAIALVFGLIGGAVLAWPTTPPRPHRMAAPTTTAKPTTTTRQPTTTVAGPARRTPDYAFTIANVSQPLVVVFPDVPADGAAAPLRSLQPPTTPPYSRYDDGRPSLPNPDYPIIGRRSFGNGWLLDNPGPFDQPLSLMVTAEQGPYLEVMLPVRPNGTRGWIPKSAATTVTTHRLIEVILSEHRLRVWEGNTLVAETAVTTGIDYSRTPTGRHFIGDKQAQSGRSKYGPWILGLNAYSEDLDSFDGGAPQIALHGWNDPAAFGRSISNGCVRVPNELIAQIATFDVGTPVDIWP